jgi:glycosyltransferase involved in cell wall biosynthesis
VGMNFEKPYQSKINYSLSEVLGPGRDPDKPLVSVVIPCYNQGRFLSNAIQSVRHQTYPHCEIVVVNDGSTDDTEAVARSFEGIRYIVQENRGLPAARNRGFEESRGDYIIFLDSDDWLYPDAVDMNLAFFRKNPKLAFVSGGFSEVYDYGNVITPFDAVAPQRDPVQAIPSDDTPDMYLLLLQGNCIGNPAAVMYARWAVDFIRFDQSGQVYGCEDYDHYLKIAREHPVLWHRMKLSYYRKHDKNMSADSSMMFRSATKALKRQEALFTTEKEFDAFQRGVKYWKKHYLFQYVGVHHRKIAKACITLGLNNDSSVDWAFMQECRDVFGIVFWKKIVRKTFKTLGLRIPPSYYFLFFIIQ